MDRSWSRATQGIEEVTCTYDVDRILVVCYDHIEAEHMQHELACLDYTTRILSLNNETNKLLNAFRNRSINVLILTYITWNAIKNAPFTLRSTFMTTMCYGSALSSKTRLIVYS